MSAVKKASKFCMLAFLLLGIAQARTTVNLAPQGASSFDNILQVTKAEVKGHEVEVEVRRLSKKAVTAYGLNLSMHYADGSERKTAVATDLIRTLVPEVSGLPVDYPGLTRYGQSHSMMINLPSDDSDAPPVAVSVSVSFVAFDDRTVVGSITAPGLQGVIAARKEEKSYLADLVAELRAFEARPDIKAALAAGTFFSGQIVLRPTIENLKHEPPKGLQTRFSSRRSADLDIFAAAGSVSKDKFDAMLARYASLQSLIAEHCDLSELK